VFDAKVPVLGPAVPNRCLIFGTTPFLQVMARVITNRLVRRIDADDWTDKNGDTEDDGRGSRSDLEVLVIDVDFGYVMQKLKVIME
jgi:hypothetical protein